MTSKQLYRCTCEAFVLVGPPPPSGGAYCPGCGTQAVIPVPPKKPRYVHGEVKNG